MFLTIIGQRKHKIENKTGPNFDPSGMVQFINAEEEEKFPFSTEKVLFRKDMSLKCSRRIPCTIVSNAAVRSIKTKIAHFPQSTANSK